MTRRLSLPITFVALLVLLGACHDDPAGQTPGAGPTATRAAAAFLTPAAALQPVRFPEDEAPHDMLTEWWYYTGHLFTADGARYGFEYVFFQARRGAFPPFYAAHFAVTDSAAGDFRYAEKAGLSASRPADQGFALELDGWTMSGALGEDRLVAALDGFAIDLTLDARKPPALHNGVGYVEFGNDVGSYYYSRTRMAASGTLTVDGQPQPVSGEAWMDHQWGNFVIVGAGGWDWFSAQLDTGHDLTISVIRDAAGAVVQSYGTLVDPAGAVTNLAPADFTVTSASTWTSPASGATYPTDWTIDLPERNLSLRLRPSIPNQELDTTRSTGVIYWEGEVLVEGELEGSAVTGLGYVELTGYDSR